MWPDLVEKCSRSEILDWYFFTVIMLFCPQPRQKGSIGLSGQPHTLQDAGVIDHVLLEKAAKKRVAVNYPEISQGVAECRFIYRLVILLDCSRKSAWIL